MKLPTQFKWQQIKIKKLNFSFSLCVSVMHLDTTHTKESPCSHKGNTTYYNVVKNSIALANWTIAKMFLYIFVILSQVF